MSGYLVATAAIVIVALAAGIGLWVLATKR
jgi:hypothetical protein